MIEVINVSKSFKRTEIVIDNLTFNVQPNNICCLLGKNGAGKSTIINMISQIISCDQGKIIINGKKIITDGHLSMAEIGVVSQFDYLIDQITGYQFLNFHCLICKIAKTEIEFRIRTLSKYFFDDEEDIFKFIRTYSSGMRMKLRIISALIHKPKILLLDEPFANLDIVTAEKLVLLLEKFRLTNSNVVLISSHDLIYVEKIATQICVIQNKNLVFNGNKSEFLAAGSGSFESNLFKMIYENSIYINDVSWLWN